MMVYVWVIGVNVLMSVYGVVVVVLIRIVRMVMGWKLMYVV